MELISHNKFDLSKHCGHIVLLYVDTMEGKVTKIKEALEMAGFVYYSYPVSIIGKNTSYDASEIFDNCSCLISVFSEEFFKEENEFVKNQFFYHIGYVCGLNKNSVLPFCLEKSHNITLERTPLQKLDFITTIEGLFDALNSRFSSKILRYNFYSNYMVNKYATSRIFYRCLHLKFKIYNTAFQNAKIYYEDFFSRAISDNAFDEILSENLICGCKIISFGNDRHLTPQMLPYKDEVYARVDDYPQIISGKKAYTLLSKENQEKTGVRAELTMDILMPIHKLLGSYFKCFITSKQEKYPVYLLLSLFEGDFIDEQPEFRDNVLESVEYWKSIYPKETFIDEENSRFYFGIGLTSNNEIEVDESLKIGDSLDYMFPQ